MRYGWESLMARPKEHWRKNKHPKASGIYHAVRDNQKPGEEATVCGVKLNANWTAPGYQPQRRGRRCRKCAEWGPMGRGPGGWT